MSQVPRAAMTCGESGEDLVPGHGDLRVVGADKVRRLPGIFQVNRVGVHADGKGADLLMQDSGADGAHQGGVQSAGEEKAQRGVRVQPLVHGDDQLFPDRLAYGLQIVRGVALYRGQVRITGQIFHRRSSAPREGADVSTQPHQVLGLAGKDDGAGAVIAVVQRPDADGVPAAMSSSFSPS